MGSLIFFKFRLHFFCNHVFRSDLVSHLHHSPFGAAGLSAYFEFLNFRNASLAVSKPARACATNFVSLSK